MANRNPSRHPRDPVSLADQSAAAGTDINRIVSQYRRTGVASTGLATNRQPMWGDFSHVDYQTMLNKVCDIQQHFSSLPARIRSRFQNDPYQLIRFVENPENRLDAVRLGLVTPTEQELVAIRRAETRSRRPEQLDLVEESEKVSSPAEEPEESDQPKKPKRKG